ncbi:melatonin receptor type 1B-A-like [Amphiura filiformis]|uniref:melatonin receptor type 1B-A-like n=1 Tax=Amphiura filiformis TaxID=82378 RepID=UPI003B226CB8
MDWNTSTENAADITVEFSYTTAQSTDELPLTFYTTEQSDKNVSSFMLTSSSEVPISSSPDADIKHEWSTLDDIYLVLTSAILVVGSVGNLMVIGAVLSHKRLRVLGNIFIVNLAIADFCVSSFINAFTIVALVTKGNYFITRLGLCEFIAIICVTTCVCSVWSIASISVNRYIKICHHSIYPYVYNKRTVGFIVGGVWFCSFLVDLPNIIGGWGYHGYDDKLMMCTYDHRQADYGSTIFFVAVGYGIPWVATVYAYLRIFIFVRQKRKALNKSQQLVTFGKKESSNRHKLGISNTDISLLRSTFTIFVLFFVMWSPYTLIVLCDPPHVWPSEVYVIAGFFCPYE